MDEKLIEDFIKCLKRLNHQSTLINLPVKGEYKKLEASSTNFSFFIDVNLKGRMGHITIQLRNLKHQDKPILRLDVTGPAHQNPEGSFRGSGKVIPCPHMHVAHPEYGDSIAYPIDDEIIKLYLTNEELNDLVIILNQFMSYINVGNLDSFYFVYQNQMNI